MEFIEINLEFLEKEEPEDKATAITVWTNSFFLRHRHKYAALSGEEILKKWNIIKGSLGPSLVGIF